MVCSTSTALSLTPAAGCLIFGQSCLLIESMNVSLVCVYLEMLEIAPFGTNGFFPRVLSADVDVMEI